MDEVGAFAGLAPLGASEHLFVRLPMQADAPGTAEFTLNPADILPQHEMVVYGSTGPVNANQVTYGSTTVVVEEAEEAASCTLTDGEAVSDRFGGGETSSHARSFCLKDRGGSLRVPVSLKMRHSRRATQQEDGCETTEPLPKAFDARER